MEKRRYGTNPMSETRAEANETVDKARRYRQIIRELKTVPGKGLTAKQIAVRMNNRRLIPTAERNFTSPRLTELMEMGVVEPIGKTTCEFTGRTVTVFALRDDK